MLYKMANIPHNAKQPPTDIQHSRVQNLSAAMIEPKNRTPKPSIVGKKVIFIVFFSRPTHLFSIVFQIICVFLNEPGGRFVNFTDQVCGERLFSATESAK